MPAPLAEEASLNVLWVGYGKMGRPMCDRVAAAGHRVSVLDAGAAQRGAAAANGLAVVTDPAAAAAEADVLVTSLPDDAAARDVLVSGSGVLTRCRHGALLIETSTISAGASRAIARTAAAVRVAYARAPVSGMVGAAANGLLSSFLSGSDDALKRLANWASRCCSVPRSSRCSRRPRAWGWASSTTSPTAS